MNSVPWFMRGQTQDITRVDIFIITVNIGKTMMQCVMLDLPVKGMSADEVQ